MSLLNKLAQYREYKSGVKHCTFNPDGPGVVRIHLIPPKFRLFGNPSYILILNGYYLLPLGYSWAVMLSQFIKKVNNYDGKPISDEDYDTIFNEAVEKAHRIYPTSRKTDIAEALAYMLDIIFAYIQKDYA